MARSTVNHIDLTITHLSVLTGKLEDFLNDVTVDNLVSGSFGDMDQETAKRVLKTLRKLSVNGEQALDTIKKAKQCGWPEEREQRLLKSIHSHYIEEYFNPVTDVWHENTRECFTDKKVIHFYSGASPKLQTLMAELSPSFSALRDELEIYA